MFREIWKYPILPKFEIEIPLPAEIISAESQNDEIVVYAIVSPTETIKTLVKFRVYGTGHEINIDTATWKFLNTVKLQDGKYMYHVFYKSIE